jgi:hypothetical protein
MKNEKGKMKNGRWAPGAEGRAFHRRFLGGNGTGESFILPFSFFILPFEFSLRDAWSARPTFQIV